MSDPKDLDIERAMAGLSPAMEQLVEQLEKERARHVPEVH